MREHFVRAVLAIVACLLVGCASQPELALTHWTLDGGAQVVLPSDVSNQLPRRGETIRLRTRAVLPPELRGRDLSLAITVQWCAPMLKVGGVAIDDIERSPFDNQRSHGAHLYRIPSHLSGVDAIELELAIEDTYGFCSTFFAAPVLAIGDHGPSSYQRVRLFNESAPIASVTIGFGLVVALLVFAFASKRPSMYLWAASATVLAQAVPLNFLGVWHFFFGYRGDLAAPLCAIASGFAMLRFVHAYFGRPPPHWAWSLFAIVASVALVVTMRRFDMRPMFATLLIATQAMTGAMLHAILRYGWRTRNGRLLLLGSALSICASAIVFLPMLGLRDIGRGAHTDMMGLTIFCIGMLVVLMRDYRAATLDLGAQLEATEALNVELRRQIAERSRDIADALGGTLTTGSEGMALEVGHVVAGRYVVVRTLGQGGMGVVYEVERKSDGKHFALKAMTTHSDANATARFAREAELVASVRHENLVDIVDVGFARSGFLYLVMELVTGGSLESSRDRFGDAAWARPLLRQIAAGLEALHARGIVHRDLKPANVLIFEHDAKVSAKIADFGISRRDEETDADPVGDTVQARKLTRTGALIGTPLYMAPELARAGTPKASSDIFSFGVLAYELLTGRYPFTTPPIAAALVNQKPVASTPTRASNPSVDAELAAIVDAALDVHAAKRPTASAIVETLG